MSYFKDISNELAKKYPNRNVYVISDEHFDHRNIIGLTRNDLLDVNDVDAMNDYIIEEHNKVVREDDIVLILGDFSFKYGHERLSSLLSRLNGHKYLVLGNHDKTSRIDIYLKAGFEDVYLYPVEFNGDYFSHYPLNATIESGERPNTILYNLLCKEFQDASSGINYHGHQHILVENGDRERNVTCEQLSYKPLLVGKTKNDKKENDALPFINEEFFDIMHQIMSHYNHFQENSIVTDYLYTIILELLSEYKDKIVVFGSNMLNKKYDIGVLPSDLDVTALYDSTKSRRENIREMKAIGNGIYEKMNALNGMHLDFYKKIDFICILSFIYASQRYNIKGYLDMNIILDEFYKSEDFIMKDGISFVEYYSDRAGIKKPQTMKYPRFSIQTTNAFGDMVNVFLQYIYTNDPEKEKILLMKLSKIVKNIDISSEKDFETLQNMLIRYLLRNMYFFETTRRRKETNSILSMKEIELPSIIVSREPLNESLQTIIQSEDYKRILNSIASSTNRKQEIEGILKYYK